MVQPCPPALDIYRALRRRNPAWYAAYLQFPAWTAGTAACAIASSSPELFLRLRDGQRDDAADQGHAPADGATDEDRAAAADLLASPKDNAELAMIIDLLRNDLGRVCRYGSVRVTEPRRLETHPTVFHLVGTVEGRLREGVGPAELLRATFPGGSITGAPKIRAMEIIDELEGLARGVYTGCVGIVTRRRRTASGTSPSAPSSATAGGHWCRSAAASWPTRSRRPNTARRWTRPAPCSRPSPRPRPRAGDAMKTFPIMLNLRGRRVVVVGGGTVGTAKGTRPG